MLKLGDKVILKGYKEHVCFVDGSFRGVTGEIVCILPQNEKMLIEFDKPVTVDTKQDTSLTFHCYSFKQQRLTLLENYVIGVDVADVNAEKSISQVIEIDRKNNRFCITEEIDFAGLDEEQIILLNAMGIGPEPKEFLSDEQWNDFDEET